MYKLLEEVRPQLEAWLGMVRKREAIQNRLAYLAEVERLRGLGLDEGDAFKNLWPEAHAYLIERGKEAKDWLKESGDESILGSR